MALSKDLVEILLYAIKEVYRMIHFAYTICIKIWRQIMTNLKVLHTSHRKYWACVFKPFVQILKLNISFEQEFVNSCYVHVNTMWLQHKTFTSVKYWRHGFTMYYKHSFRQTILAYFLIGYFSRSTVTDVPLSWRALLIKRNSRLNRRLTVAIN